MGQRKTIRAYGELQSHPVGGEVPTYLGVFPVKLDKAKLEALLGQECVCVYMSECSHTCMYVSIIIQGISHICFKGARSPSLLRLLLPCSSSSSRTPGPCPPAGLSLILPPSFTSGPCPPPPPPGKSLPHSFPAGLIVPSAGAKALIINIITFLFNLIGFPT